ncbi:hypothetical protein Tc00.1047053511771.185 [Trypanosoma cruzi]|uniref:Secreted protein n=1 Tax=Trypanosoma cruzi (strain CL Brener) TaxID=353153 RepID=Q4DUJ1_TRYCC|nr:hypothetical protein Tc00.1047053511771.185 [Trypanosoma cruzi]EAN96195.1 hypothetical protein Tc00.1047053511771.185 [Trypanosoma cruzi]|eukprot:XP_818046.1 hypothetical protein [Trypanosoma cruzi strain CL Brener]
MTWLWFSLCSLAVRLFCAPFLLTQLHVSSVSRACCRGPHDPRRTAGSAALQTSLLSGVPGILLKNWLYCLSNHVAASVVCRFACVHKGRNVRRGSAGCKGSSHRDCTLERRVSCSLRGSWLISSSGRKALPPTVILRNEKARGPSQPRHDVDARGRHLFTLNYL